MKNILSVPLLLLLALAPAGADSTTKKLEEERLDQSGTVITIIFDDSGSMQGEKLKQAKSAFREWLTTVPDNYRLGLVALNAGKLVESRRGNKSEVADAVSRIKADGGTPLADTMARVNAEVRARKQQFPYERQVVVIFTDGKDSSYQGTDRVQQELANASRAMVETVGIGFHGEGDYMSGAATRYFDANNTQELREGLEKVDAEIGDTKDIVIDDATLQEMKSIKPPTPAPVTAEVAGAPENESTAPTTTQPTTSTSRRGGFGFLPIVILFIVAATVLSKFFKASK